MSKDSNVGVLAKVRRKVIRQCSAYLQMSISADDSLPLAQKCILMNLPWVNTEHSLLFNTPHSCNGFIIDITPKVTTSSKVKKNNPTWGVMAPVTVKRQPECHQDRQRAQSLASDLLLITGCVFFCLKFFFYWRVADLQCCASFRCIKRFSFIYINV